MDTKRSIDYKVAESIRNARIEKGFDTQQAFADALVKENGESTHFKTVQAWETGRSKPDLDSLFLMSKVLDVDIDYLIGRLSKPTHDIEFINNETGLSTEAISVLKHQQEINDTDTSSILSEIISHRLFVELIRTISVLSRPSSDYNKIFMDSVINHIIDNNAIYLESPEDIRSLYETQIVRLFSLIINDVTSQMKK